MRHWRWLVMVTVIAVAALAVSESPAVEQFPPPDFTEHALPTTAQPSARAEWFEYLDLAVLVGALCGASYLALVKRSRRGLFLLGIASLAWLGFWRHGCICPIGSIQNVALATFEGTYALPWTVAAFFALPIVFTLFFGRTFCAAVCPLGAVQEMFVLRPVKVPPWIDHTLGLLAYIYLGAGVLFAATGTAFIICRYDPFVGFFRRSAGANMLILGVCFLVVGIFIGRPYCRYLCPYGAILGIVSLASKWHVRIPPNECSQCRLCEESCPYGAIREPTVAISPVERRRGRRRLAALLALLPLLIATGFWLGRQLEAPFAQLHPTVRLADRIRLEQTGHVEGTVDASDAFRNTGRTVNDLYYEARLLSSRFRQAGGWFGAWIGLVIGIKLIHLSVRRRRSDYQPDRTACVSCGRCFWYCPNEQARQGWIQESQLIMNDTSHEASYQLATRIAAMAGVFALVVCSLLMYDYARRMVKDPLDSTAYQALVGALDQQPANDTLKAQIRDLDLQLRSEYFRQRAFTYIGAALLLVAMAVFLAAAKTAATLHRRLPAPDTLSTPQNYEAAWTRLARWAVAALCVAMVGVAIATIISVRSEWQEESEEIAAASTPVPPVEKTRAETSSPSVAKVSETPPSDEEMAKMWPQFRGPGGLGVSAYTNVPETWDGKSGQGVLWKTPVPLPGNNSPVVWDKRVFLSGADKSRREVYCFDADNGKLLWQQAVPGTPQSTARPPKVNEETGYAASTTATDGRRLFAIFANGDVAAFDFSGKLAWSKSLGLPENSYGHASSLATHKNLLLVQLDQGSSRTPKSKLLAFNSATGGIVWQVDRPVPNSWASPIVICHGDRDQVVTAADPWVIAYNPADGTEIWRVKCLQTDIGPSPTFADGKVFVANDNSVLAAIRADGRGDVTGTHVLWKGEEGLPDTSSPLATKEFVLLLTSYGTLTCYDAVKGDMLWTEEFEVDFSASPALVGNHVYLIAKTGKAWIVEPGREKCKRLGEADLAEECVTSPAFLDGRIYLRGKTYLFCLGK